jgi:glutaredoxin 3
MSAAVECRVVVLGRSTCPFCTEVDRALADRFSEGGRKHVYYRIDKLENGAALHKELKEKTGQTSVPYVFVNGNLVGGCTDVFAGGYDGSLSGVLGALPENMAAADPHSPDTCAPRIRLAMWDSSFVPPYNTLALELLGALGTMQRALNLVGSS